MTYVPKTFAKGDVTEVAVSARQAVALKFKGYKEVEAKPAAADEKEPAYAELVAQAKDLQSKGHDLKASGSYDDLLSAVTLAQVDQNEIDNAEANA